MPADPQEAREIEIKLVLQRQHVKRLRLHPLLSEGFRQSGKSVRQESVYFDDSRQTLRKKGISLRVRSFGERRIQTIKALNGHAGSVDRGEWQTAVARNRPDLAAAAGTPLELVLAKLRGPLKPVFETRVARTSFPLKFGASEIQVALDQGKIDTGGMAAPICELELELKRGNAGDLFRLAQKLDGKVPLTLSYETKSGRGYALLEGLAPWVAKAEAVRMRPGVSCADAFRAIAHECLRQMIQNREGIAQGKSEALHQMRIAVRRFRSALTIFRDLVAGEGAEAVKAELRALRELTGPARDLDLFVNEVIAPLRAELPKDRELAAFERLARRERSRATRAARKAILSSPFRKFVMHAAAWVESGDWRTSADALTQARQDAPVEIYAAELLAPMHRKVRNHGQALRELDDERRHRLRVRAKKLRYAAEFFAGLASDKKTRKRARRMIESLRTLQDKLGALNDLAVYRNLATETGLAMTSEPQRSRNGHDAGAIADLIARRQSVRLEPLMQEAVEAFSEFRAAKPYWKWSRKRMIRSEKAERRPAEEAVSAPEAKKAA